MMFQTVSKLAAKNKLKNETHQTPSPVPISSTAPLLVVVVLDRLFLCVLAASAPRTAIDALRASLEVLLNELF